MRINYLVFSNLRKQTREQSWRSSEFHLVPQNSNLKTQINVLNRKFVYSVTLYRYRKTTIKNSIFNNQSNNLDQVDSQFKACLNYVWSKTYSLKKSENQFYVIYILFPNNQTPKDETNQETCSRPKVPSRQRWSCKKSVKITLLFGNSDLSADKVQMMERK